MEQDTEAKRPKGLAIAGRLIVAGLAVALIGCGDGDGTEDSRPPDPKLSAAAALGEKIFNDPGLSASGRISCATCHDPATAHATGNADIVVPAGGAAGDVSGFRNAPSLRYLTLNPAFFFDAEGTPRGGFNRDGRAASLAEQAQRPFLAALEMANATVEAVIAKLAIAPYVDEFRRVFGAGILNTPDAAFDRMRLALARYQREDREFRPFDSKYDLFVTGRVSLTGRELQGLALFNDPLKGNCAACHPSGRGGDGSPPLFTDFTYDNIGVPRNPAIAANADPEYFDRGLCGPFRADLAERTDLCGAFKVPHTAQRRRHGALLPQRPLQDAEGSRRLLRTPRYQSRGVVSAEAGRQRWKVRRPAAGVPRQRQHDRGAVRPQGR